MTSSNSKTLRCAVYTRKSTEEGLDQDFNSLDAQREACEAYIASQASLGWKLSPSHYDDGGISGGTMERPALRQLLDDIKLGQIDVVVVYKIDRLTRSLMDFAKIVDVFDEKGVSFVSVTQQFNTTTSMGRLTLNVLLSFAQFEREVTAERIRDKVAASKKKGMWMGGVIPLGYRSENKKLVVDTEEANTVRHLFTRYLELGSVKQLSEEAKEQGLVGRITRQKDGTLRKTAPFGRGNLYHLLSNPIYTGKVRHQEKVYAGEHDAIIDDELWNDVQIRMSENTKERCSTTNTRSASILTGLGFDETGDRLSPVHAMKNGVRYRYYISNRLSNAGSSKADGWRLPALELEQAVLTVLDDHLTNPLKLGDLIGTTRRTIQQQESLIAAAGRLANKLLHASNTHKRTLITSFVERITLSPDQLAITIDALKLSAVLTSGDKLAPSHQHRNEANGGETLRTVEMPHQLKRRGVEAKLVLTQGQSRPSKPDDNLIKLVAKAHHWLKQLTDGTASSIGELAKQTNEDGNEISRFLPLAYLAPDIIEAIVAGTHPVELTAESLRRHPALPYNWMEQRSLLGFSQ